ncbi:MAG: hypothetical protein PHH85_01580 [Candidatus Methanoperedens sp.]|nr:hypothetical protein [Candidatus Methanoperedens sp.]
MTECAGCGTLLSPKYPWHLCPDCWKEKYGAAPGWNKKDNEFWLNTIVRFELNVLSLMALHGNLCLALRHPDNKGESRGIMIHFVQLVGRKLVELNAITPDQRKEAESGLVVP